MQIKPCICESFELKCEISFIDVRWQGTPDRKVHGAYMEPTWVLSATGGSHVGPNVCSLIIKALKQQGVMFTFGCSAREPPLKL